ncbi:(R)-stereoselective amidase (plasmid) [Burkholderia sp. AD24]|nr:(R)-stereoselective amidase [Burkholderia sp. AD24]
MKVTFGELPDQVNAGDSPGWDQLGEHLEHHDTDLLILNEMPFGQWLASSQIYNAAQAEESIEAHRCGIGKLGKLNVPAIVSSRPVPSPAKLANEAFLLQRDSYTPIHHKHYFPEQSGFFEKTWFEPARLGFNIAEVGALRIGVLLCTELMFTEWARHYRRQGANVIAVPRTSGTSMHYWHTAAAMAALVSGCYVVSSNRRSVASTAFGGGGFVFSPEGFLLMSSTLDQPIVTIELDLEAVTSAQKAYPCCVEEISSKFEEI